MSAITDGTEIQADASVRLEKNGQMVNGVGADIDVMTASTKAYSMHSMYYLLERIKRILSMKECN